MLIICCGMIRSGSTLQYNYVVNTLETKAKTHRKGWFPPNKLRLSLPLLLAWSLRKDYYVIKVHAFPAGIITRFPRARTKFIFSHRDLRDVAVSAMIKFDVSGDRLLQLVDQAASFYWKLQKLPAEQSLSQAYEKLRDAPSESVLEISQKLHLSLSAAEAEKIVAPADGDADAAGATAHSGENSFNAATLFHADHISSNKGRSGIWQEQLEPAVAEAIVERHRGLLEKEGYL